MPPKPARIKPSDLLGLTIMSAAMSDDHSLTLTLSRIGSPDDLTCCVMCDPEGNGPGSVHVYGKRGDFLGVL
jgi:hypothetical protein